MPVRLSPAPSERLPTPLRQMQGIEDSLPPWLLDLVRSAQISPVSTNVEPQIGALGKPVSELLDTVFTPTAKGTGLPRRLRLTNWDAPSGNLQFHGGTPTGPRFEATPDQLSQLISGGALGIEQPPAGLFNTIQRRLSQMLGPK